MRSGAPARKPDRTIGGRRPPTCGPRGHCSEAERHPLSPGTLSHDCPGPQPGPRNSGLQTIRSVSPSIVRGVIPRSAPDRPAGPGRRARNNVCRVPFPSGVTRKGPLPPRRSGRSRRPLKALVHPSARSAGPCCTSLPFEGPRAGVRPMSGGARSGGPFGAWHVLGRRFMGRRPQQFPYPRIHSGSR